MVRCLEPEGWPLTAHATDLEDSAINSEGINPVWRRLLRRDDANAGLPCKAILPAGEPCREHNFAVALEPFPPQNAREEIFFI